MNMFDEIYDHWLDTMQSVHESGPFKRLLKLAITPDHYKSLLQEIFFHTRENPQIQALATVYFRGKQRDMVKPFYKHAISEIGHDQLALNDIEDMGYDTSSIRSEFPLPATSALLAYAFYQIQHLNPVGYLGYLFHLEYMPTHFGKEYMKALKAVGVKESSMSFVEDHHVIDQGHIKLMKSYIETLVTDEEELNIVKNSISVTAKLYTNMIGEAFQRTDAQINATIEKKQSEYMESVTVN